jgi:nicotinamide riboside transporter PnuC
MFNAISFVCMALSLVGYYFIIKKNHVGFYYWLLSNTGWIFIDLYKGIYFQAFMFFIFSLLAIDGILKWRINKRKEGFRKAQEELYVSRSWR